MRKIFTVLFFFTVAFASDNYPRVAGLDALHYRISIDIDDSTDFIKGKTEILFAITSNGVSQIPLDFVGLTVQQVLEQNQPAKFSHADGRLVVSLEKNYRSGNSCWISILYNGRPTDGLFIRKNKFGNRAVFADNWPNRARYWFPSIDHPYDKATVEFFVTAPVRYDVVANGGLEETTSKQNGFKLTHWSESVPIPTYCMVIGATEFSIVHAGLWNGIPLSYWLYPKDRDNGIKDYGRALQMIEFYSNLIGPYPYEKLALVQSSTRFGGMENSSAIFFSERAYNGSGRLEGTVAHEIAHQWFGDAVTEADWHHLWLSEGFASYFGSLFFEHLYGQDSLKVLMRRARTGYLNAMKNDPHSIHDTTITDLFKLLNAYNYQKGAWVLHMLRKEMGDENFFAGVREYYATYRNGNALTEDFQKIMEKHAGRALNWFFKQWIYQVGHPVFSVAWSWNEKKKEANVQVTQEQDGPLFNVPLTLEVRSGEKTQRFDIRMNNRFASISIPSNSKLSSVLVDPDEWILKEVSLVEGK